MTTVLIKLYNYFFKNYFPIQQREWRILSSGYVFFQDYLAQHMSRPRCRTASRRISLKKTTDFGGKAEWSRDGSVGRKHSKGEPQFRNGCKRTMGRTSHPSSKSRTQGEQECCGAAAGSRGRREGRAPWVLGGRARHTGRHARQDFLSISFKGLKAIHLCFFLTFLSCL